MIWVQTLYHLKFVLGLLSVRRFLHYYYFWHAIQQRTIFPEENPLQNKCQHFQIFTPVICLRPLRMLLLIIKWNTLLFNAQSGCVSLGAKWNHFVFSCEILILHCYRFIWTITLQNNYERRKCRSIKLFNHNYPYEKFDMCLSVHRLFMRRRKTAISLSLDA
jgi:hypothetical protein